MKGLLVTILRNADGSDCTNGGASAQHTKAILVGAGVPEIFEAGEGDLVLMLEKRTIGGKYCPCVAPVQRKAGCLGPMFGGNYVVTSDSRFNPEQFGAPIPIHDRFETQEEYDRLST